MFRVIWRIVVVLAIVMAVDHLWLGHRLVSRLPVRLWLDRCAQAIERFGHALVGG